MPNSHQGPDFQGAAVWQGSALRTGAVEIHVRGDDWFAHGHHTDPFYASVVLHVVWEASSQPIVHAGLPDPIPELVLSDYVLPNADAIVARFRSTLQSLPCQAKRVGAEHYLAQLERCGRERIVERSQRLTQTVDPSDWYQIAWRSVLGAFGAPQNREAFEALADALPIRVLQKQAHSAEAVEALLLGVAGFLEQVPTELLASEPWLQRIHDEWQYQRVRCGVQPLPGGTFSFLRMRPAHFPTIRLAQVAAWLRNGTQPGDWLAQPLGVVRQLMRAVPSDYWATHYLTTKPASPEARPATRPPAPGKVFAQTVVVNGLVPVVHAYRRALQQPDALSTVVRLLETLPAEKYPVLDKLAACGFVFRNAADTQAALQLHKAYCTRQACMDCAVGRAVLAQAFHSGSSG
jgi:hypothetical protein